jgi:hypothetical protein
MTRASGIRALLRRNEVWESSAVTAQKAGVFNGSVTGGEHGSEGTRRVPFFT